MHGMRDEPRRAGDFREYRFYPAVMYSQARLTYTKVAAMLGNPKGEEAKQYETLLPHIQLALQIVQGIAESREKRGAIDFETIETQMIFNDQGKIERILPVKRNDAHRLIEECMLAANVCASDFLQKNKQPTLYRIHEGPTPDKLVALRDFLKEFGVQLGGGSAAQRQGLRQTLTKSRIGPMRSC